jgi:hypothetical protein
MPTSECTAHARRCFARAGEPLLVPVLVITELAYLLRSRLGANAEAGLVDLIDGEGIVVEPVLDIGCESASS